MRTIIVTSTNPVKLEAVRAGFNQVFSGETFSFQALPVPSGVPDQPFSDAQTRLGAANRILAGRQAAPQADFWTALEGGVEKDGDDLLAFAWVMIQSAGQSGRARSASFVLPKPLSRLITAGMEMGEADDVIFNQSNTKQKSGAVGLLTRGVVDRAALYSQAVILALIPFINKPLYSN